MGRQTKKQRARKAQKPTETVEVDPSPQPPTEYAWEDQYRRPPSQFPPTAKRGIRPGSGLLQQDTTFPRGFPGMGTPPGRRGPNPDSPIAQAFKKVGENLSAARERRGEMPGGGSGSKARPSALQQEQARRRLEALNTFLHSKSTPIIEQLRGLGVPFEIMHNVRGDRRYDTLVVKVTDLEAADAKIASKGTLYDQLYNGEAP